MAEAPPLALVTGASSEIGLKLAELFARDGYDLIAVADSADMLGLAEKISAEQIGAGQLGAGQTGGARTTVTAVVADLGTEDGIRAVGEALDLDGRTPAAAALNAGIGRGGRFVDAPKAKVHGVLAKTRFR